MKDSNFLKENNARHVWHPMAHPADSQTNLPTILTGGRDVFITDVDGHEVLDAVGGLWNVNLGYSCEPVKQAISDQLNALPYYSIFRGTSNDKVIELSYELADFFAPEGLTRTFFTSGGSDSVEVALKLARQYHRIRGEAGRTKFLSLKKAITVPISAAPASTATASSATLTSPCCRAVSTFRLPTPTAIRSTRAIRRNLPSSAQPPSKTRSPSREPAPLPPSSWSPSSAPVVSCLPIRASCRWCARSVTATASC